MKFKKDDKVIVITGKDKGKRGGVIKTFPSIGKVLISGINMYAKHIKASQQYPSGKIISKEMPIVISNIAHLDPKEDVATKVGYKFLDDGKKVRYAKKSGEIIYNNVSK